MTGGFLMLRYVCGLQLLIATKKLVDRIAGLGAAILSATHDIDVLRAITSSRYCIARSMVPAVTVGTKYVGRWPLVLLQ